MKFWLKPGSFSIRLDQLLVAVGLFESKLLAGKQIKKGLVSVNESTEFDYARKLVENDKIRFGDNFYYIAMKKDDKFIKKSNFEKSNYPEKKFRNFKDERPEDSPKPNHYNKDSTAIEHTNKVKKWIEKPIKIKKKR